MDVTWLEGVIGVVTSGAVIGAATGLHKAYRKLTSIKEQTEPNGGSSMCDTINRIETKVDTAITELGFQRCEATLSGDVAKRNTFRTDAEGANLFVSRSYCRALGCLQEDLEGKRWQQIIHPDDSDAYLARLNEALRVGGRFEAQVRLLKQDKTEIPVLVHADPVVIDGKFRGMTGEWEAL